MYKIKIFLLTFCLLQFKMSISQNLKVCDSVLFHSDNERNDSSKFYITNTGIADTTAYCVYGKIKDRNTLKPIKNATLFLTDHSGKLVLKSKTNKDGKFSIVSFHSEDVGSLKIICLGYHCLHINEFEYGGTGYLIEILAKLLKL